MKDSTDIFETAPWTRTDDASWRFRETHVYDPRVAPLNKLVEALRQETGSHVPWIDPFCGGVEAKVLLVLLRPGPLGAMATNFLSLANGDATARNTIQVMSKSGIGYGEVTFWNAIPWFGLREEKITSGAFRRGSVMFTRLLPLLPNLKAAILLGRQAQRLEGFISQPPSVTVLTCALPSPFVWNQHRYRALKQGIFVTFRIAASLSGGDPDTG